MQDAVDRIMNRVRKLTFSSQPTNVPEKTVITIQRWYRRYAARKRLNKLLKRRHARKQVLMELLATQRQYLRDLEVIIEEVKKPLEAIMDEQMHQMLFINIDEIRQVHRHFIIQLEDLVKNYSYYRTMISNSLMHLIPKLKAPYYRFCLQYKKSNQILRLLRISNSDFNNLVQQLILKGVMKFELSSYLIKPVQRLCKYSLLIKQLIRYTDAGHPDLPQLDSAMVTILQMVKETNDQIEEFVRQEKLLSLHQRFGSLNQPGRKFHSDFKASLVNKEQDKLIQVQIFLFYDMIMLVSVQDNKETQQRYQLDEASRVKLAPDAKYFKNLICIITSGKTLTLSCKTVAKQQQLLQAIQQVLTPLQQGTKTQGDLIEVDVEGTEERETTFSKYTVYIINIRAGGHGYKIFPRWSQLLQVQNGLQKVLPNVKPPQLEKQDWYSTRKTKTIQKRKFAILQFLTFILNDKQVRQQPSVMTALNLQKLGISIDTALKRRNTLQESIMCLEVYIAYDHPLNCWISSRGKVSDLKQHIADHLGLKKNTEYGIFQRKDKITRLLYDDEPLNKLKVQKKGLLKMIFSQSSILLYTRYCYLSDNQQRQCYKSDPKRLQLEVAIIRSELMQYNLDIEMKMTVLALLASYENVPTSSDQKLMAFLNSIKDLDKPGLVYFREFCYEIDEVLHKDQVSAQEVLIKVMSQCQLYRCRQFRCQAYPKTFKEVKKIIPEYEDQLILGVKRSQLLLLNSKRKTLKSLSYTEIREMQVYASSLIFHLEGWKQELRLDTSQSFQISKLIEKYSPDVVTRKMND